MTARQFVVAHGDGKFCLLIDGQRATPYRYDVGPVERVLKRWTDAGTMQARSFEVWDLDTATGEQTRREM